MTFPLIHNKYKEKHCKRLIELMTDGGTAVTLCAEIGVSKQTFYNWIDMYPEFKEAYDVALAACEEYWNRKGRENEDNSAFNQSLYAFNMAIRFGVTNKSRRVRTKIAAPKDKVVKNAKTTLDRFNNLVHSFDGGEITPEELEKLAGSFVKTLDMKEREDVMKRVEELLAQHGKN